MVGHTRQTRAQEKVRKTILRAKKKKKNALRGRLRKRGEKKKKKPKALRRGLGAIIRKTSSCSQMTSGEGVDVREKNASKECIRKCKIRGAAYIERGGQKGDKRGMVNKGRNKAGKGVLRRQ